MHERRSLLGFDEDHTLLEKLGLFLVTLLLGPLLALLLFAGIQQFQEPWRSIAFICCEVLAVFWASLLVFIWWRPSWFRRHYMYVERKAVVVVLVVGIGLFLYVGADVLAGWLRAIRMD